jgi:hypothetical protein
MMHNTDYPDNGVTIRNPATTLFCVDSADRVSTANIVNPINPSFVVGEPLRDNIGTGVDMLINKPQSLVDGYIKRMALTEVCMDWNVPNVNERNQYFAIWMYGSKASPFTTARQIAFPVPAGFYTPLELAAQITTQMKDIITDASNAAIVADLSNTNVLMSIDPKTLYFTLTDLSGNARFSLLNFSNDPAVPSVTYPNAAVSGTGASVADIRDKSIFDLIGWNSLLINQSPAVISPEVVASYRYDTIVGSYAPMSYTRYIDITSSNLCKKQNVKDGSTQPSEMFNNSILARIYICNNFNESRFDSVTAGCNIVGTRPYQLYKMFDSPKYIYWDAREFINNVDLQVRDDAGQLLYNIPVSLINAGTGAVRTAINANTGRIMMTFQMSEN